MTWALIIAWSLSMSLAARPAPRWLGRPESMLLMRRLPTARGNGSSAVDAGVEDVLLRAGIEDAAALGRDRGQGAVQEAGV